MGFADSIRRQADQLVRAGPARRQSARQWLANSRAAAAAEPRTATYPATLTRAVEGVPKCPAPVYFSELAGEPFAAGTRHLATLKKIH